MMSIAAAIVVLLVAAAVVLLREFMSGRAFRVIGFGPIGGSVDLLQLTEASKPESRKIEERDDTPPVTPSAPAAAAEAEPSADADEDEAEDEEAEKDEGDGKKPGGSELAQIVADPEIRIALFAGAEGGEGAGSFAFSAAKQAAKEKIRCIVIDMGRKPSEVLGNERPGLCDLLAGTAAFGEVIQRDENARVHIIPFGDNGDEPPMQRIQLVAAALVHTYDKVILVADKLDDWPDEHLRPDVAAIVCGPETTELLRTEVYDTAIARGAKSAIIVRYTSDLDLGREESAAA
jgi:hypothetical protein